MRMGLVALVAIASLSGCLASGKAWHKEQALRECDEIINPQERSECRRDVQNEAWRRDAETTK